MAPRYIVSSRDASLQWPRVPSGEAATVLALHAQNERSQWLAEETLWTRQLVQLRTLLAHCQATVPYYRDRLTDCFEENSPLDRSRWEALPILTRRALQENFDALKSEVPPASHGATSAMQSSGSTGTPVRFMNSRITTYFYYANNLRHYRWHEYDPAARYAGIVRLNAAQQKLSEAGKPVPWMMGYATGPHFYFDIGRPVSEQLAWLQEVQPQYLTTYPSNLRNLLDHCNQGSLPFLRAITTMSEVLNDETRAACEATLGVPVQDIYSAQEIGIAALQCPSGGGYHVMSESVLLEILDEAGMPCASGEVGRVIATPLQNFITPLIRYELGDFAEVGEPCACGRGLPTVRRFLGRVRNILVLPSGEKIWPSFGSRGLTAIAPIRQHQIVQKTRTDLEAHLVVERTLTKDEEAQLTAHLTARLPEMMHLRFVYVDAIPRGPGGKFEDFVSDAVDS